MCSLQPNTDADNKNATVLTRSMEDYGVCLAFNVDIDVDADFISGYTSYDRDVPSEPDSVEFSINNFVISGLMITDGGYEVIINNEEINQKVKDIVDNSDILDDFILDKE